MRCRSAAGGSTGHRPNGAGKTHRPHGARRPTDVGSVRIFGTDAWADAGGTALRRDGGRSRGCSTARLDPRRVRSAFREELVERFEFDPSKKGREYSKGNRQKIKLIAAFMVQPDLLRWTSRRAGSIP
jgi:ABC-2 type transport system ATP-binding protein